MNDTTKIEYQFQKADVKKAGEMLARAFVDDPVFKLICEGMDFDQRSAFYECPVKQCLTYGEVFSSNEINGLCAIVHSDYIDMNLWQVFKSGILSSAKRIGTEGISRLNVLSGEMKKQREENMKSRKHLYITIVGVDPEHQGKGIGKELIQKVIEKSEKEKLPIYLETETEGNVEMYKKFGFDLMSKINLESLNVPMWGLVREIKK